MERAEAPIAEFERELAREHASSLPGITARLTIIDRKIKAIGRSDEIEQLTALESERTELQAKQQSPCLLTGDATSERLAEIMMANGGAALSMSGEARGITQVLTGYYNDGKINESIYLSGFVVNEHFRQQRKSSADRIIERPCLTLGTYRQWEVAVTATSMNKICFEGKIINCDVASIRRPLMQPPSPLLRLFHLKEHPGKNRGGKSHLRLTRQNVKLGTPCFVLRKDCGEMCWIRLSKNGWAILLPYLLQKTQT